MIDINKLYLDYKNRIIIPYYKIHDNLWVCYITIDDIYNLDCLNVMKLLYLSNKGICFYNKDESISKQLTYQSKLYKKHKHIIKFLKRKMKTKEFYYYYYNVLIFPKEFTNGNIKFDKTNK